MNKIEQTTLSIEDNNEHYEFLLRAGTNEQVIDGMLERFIHTFLGEYKPESR